MNTGRVVEGADHNGPGSRTTGFGGVRPHVAQAGWYMKNRFGIGTVGGVGTRPNVSDHPKGLALDFMTWGENGTALANYAMANRAHLGVTYAIWRQMINSGGGWRRMADRGNPTANHFDHVHVSFVGDGGTVGDATGPAFIDIGAMIREGWAKVTGALSGASAFQGSEWGRGVTAMGTKMSDAALQKLLSSVTGGVFDSGGVATHPGVMLKGTPRPERVLSPDQTASFERLVSVLDRTGRVRAAPASMLAGDPIVAELRALGAVLRDQRGVTYAPTINNPVAETATETKASDARTAAFLGSM
jgi:hypothetical protein